MNVVDVASVRPGVRSKARSALMADDAGPAVEIGLFLSDPDGVVDEAKHAERLGYDFVAAGDHLWTGQPTLQPFVALSAAAATTERIALMSSVAVLGFYAPPLLAKLALSLQRLSSGRFRLGVGLGGSLDELATCGAASRRRGVSADSALAELRQAISGADVQAGTWPERLRDAKTQIPLYVGGRGMAAVARAHRMGGTWLPYSVTPNHIRRCREQAGVPNLATGVVVHCRLTDERTGAAGEDAARELAGRLSGPAPRPDAIAGSVIVGDTVHCVRRISAYLEVGVRSLTVSFLGPRSSRPRQIEQFAAEVAPDLVASARTAERGT